MYTHNLEITNKNLISTGENYVYLTTDHDLLKGDAVKIQDKVNRTEENFIIKEVIEDAPLCKKGVFAVVLVLVED